MADLKLNTNLSQQLVMTPQLQQAIKILQMPIAELEDFVQEELLQNPVLEEYGKKSESLDRIQSELEEASNSENDDNLYSGKSAGTLANSNIKVGEKFSLENISGKTNDLKDHMLWQARFLDVSEAEMAFAELIIYDLNSDGYLHSTLEELLLEFARIYPKLSLSMDINKAERILSKIQDFDPPGVASRTVQECLLHQLSDLGIRNTLVELIISEYLDKVNDLDFLLGNLHYKKEEIEKALEIIRSLEPKPGRVYSNVDITYVVPDVYVYKYGDEYLVLLNDENIPQLRLSNYYLSMIENSSKLDKKTKGFITEKIKEAYSLIKSIDHRQTTLKKVTEVIVKRQRDFFEKGIVGLKPLILRDIASEISVHESTVSRVTSNKFVHTPHGIFELKYFLNNNVSSSSSGFQLASDAIKYIIKELIVNENPEKPLSDAEISYILKEKNLDVARRTISKYRESMGIPSSTKRKRGGK